MYSRYVVRLCLLGYIRVISVVTTTLFVTKEGLVESLNDILPRVLAPVVVTMVMTVLSSCMTCSGRQEYARECIHGASNVNELQGLLTQHISCSRLQTTVGVLATSDTRSSHAQSRPSAFILALSSPYPHPPRSPPPTSHQTLSARALPQSPEHHVQ